MKQTLGDKIASLRKQQSLTQEQLGARLGVSGQAVSKWEKGESMPDLLLLPDLCSLLGISADALLEIGRAEQPHKKTVWGLEYLKSTRAYFWNDDYLEFLVKSEWKLEQPVRILDFGCGYGYLGIKLLPLLPQGSTYTGIDLDEELLHEARELFEGTPYQAELIHANFLDYRPEQKYDLAICQAVLRHTPQGREVLKSMIDSVKEGGKVICIEVNRRMENAGIYLDGAEYDMEMRDLELSRQWKNELQNGGRDALMGIKLPIYMEELGLRDVSVRVNDYVEFVSPQQDKERYEEHLEAFLRERGLKPGRKRPVSAIGARSLLISWGTKPSG